MYYTKFKKIVARQNKVTDIKYYTVNQILQPDFFYQQDVVNVARQLLGKVLVTYIDNQLTAGIITETEAYSGCRDRACHASNGKTNRTSVMYDQGGVAYVYLCYGIHHLFNIVTNVRNYADAVLVRALEPLDGIDAMLARRNKSHPDHTLTSGPGSLSRAMGINLSHYGAKLYTRENIWIEDRGLTVSLENIKSTPRIGVAYAGTDALLPWRLYIDNNKYVSKGKFIQKAD